MSRRLAFFLKGGPSMRRGHFLRPLGLRHHLCSLRDAARFSLRFPGRQGFLSCSGRPLSLGAAHCAPSRCGIPSCGDDHLNPSGGMLGSTLLYGLPASFGGVTPLHAAVPMLRSDVRFFRPPSGYFPGAIFRCGPLRLGPCSWQSTILSSAATSGFYWFVAWSTNFIQHLGLCERHPRLLRIALQNQWQNYQPPEETARGK